MTSQPTNSICDFKTLVAGATDRAAVWSLTTPASQPHLKENMTSPTLNTPLSASTPANGPTSRETLTELLHALRQVTSGLHTELRQCLSKERNLLVSPPPQSHTRLAERLNKAYELLRQGESKIELLVLHFGGSL